MTKLKYILGAGILAAGALGLAATAADLTPMGAEKAGNAARTIPAWDGGLKSAADAGATGFTSGATTRIRTPPTNRPSRSTHRTCPSTRPT